MFETESLPCAALTLDLEEAVFAAMLSFDAGLRLGHRPRAEDYLSDLPEPERTDLLCELVALEISFRLQAPARKSRWLPAAEISPLGERPGNLFQTACRRFLEAHQSLVPQ